MLDYLLLATLVAGAVLLAQMGSAHRSRERLARGLSALLLVPAAVVAVWPGQAGRPWYWIPNTPPASFAAAPPAGGLVLSLYALLAVTMWRLIARQSAGAWPGLCFILCALVVAALTVDQFLMRYAFLEVIALLTILAMALESPALRAGGGLWRRYLQFRVGDVGLVVVIVVLERLSGTLRIDPMLAALPAGSAAQRGLVLGGGLLAAWVKLGLPPFHGWVADLAHTRPAVRLWLGGLGLPLTAAYLLYRLSPALRAPAAAPWVVLAGTLGLAYSVAQVFRVGREPERGRAAAWWLAIHGALGIALSATPLARAYLLAFVPVRAGAAYLLALRPLEVAPRVVLAVAGSRVPGNGCSLEDGPAGVSTGRPGPGLSATFQPLLAAASAVEELLERGNRWAARAAWSAGQALQDRHRGRLRTNLLWATIGLLALIVVALASNAP